MGNKGKWSIIRFMVEIGKAGSWFKSKFTWPGADHQLKRKGGEIKIKIYFIEFLYIGFFVIDLIYIGNICIPDFL